MVARWPDVSDGSAIFWSQGEGKDAFRLIVVRTGQQVYAYVNRCAHFGVPLAEKREQLIFRPHESISCNVHYARYGWQDGKCVAGDCAGEGLLVVPVEVVEDAIQIAR